MRVRSNEVLLPAEKKDVDAERPTENVEQIEVVDLLDPVKDTPGEAGEDRLGISELELVDELGKAVAERPVESVERLADEFIGAVETPAPNSDTGELIERLVDGFAAETTVRVVQVAYDNVS